MISVIFPTHNEEGNVLELHGRLKKTLDEIGEEYEIIAVDDCSIDETVSKLKTLSPIKIIVFAKNMGQSAALNAGICAAEGDIVAILDADLQNNPEDIPILLKKLREGYDVVSGRRVNRKDPLYRKIISLVANFLTYKVMGIKLHDFAAPLKVCRKEVLDGVVLYGGMHSFLPAILYARGAKVTEVPVGHNERKHGKTKYTSSKLAKAFADLMVVKFLSDYLARPLLFFGGLGLFSIFLGFVSAGASLTMKVMEIRNITQTPLPILATLFVVVGVLLIMMGFLAEMLLRIYFETKGRTPYIIKSIIENGGEGEK